MKKIRKEEVWQDIVVEITCDKCKKSYDSIFELQEFLSITTIGGFASIYGDGTTIEVDICQYCLEDIFKGVVRLNA